MSDGLWTLGNALYCGLALALGLICWFQWRYRDILRVATKLPVTFPAWPLLGHGYFMFWGLEVGTKYIMDWIERGIEKGHKIQCFWVGPMPYITLMDMEDIRLIMNSSKTLDKSDEYQLMKEGLGTVDGPLKYAILTAPGPVWKVTRKHMNAMFTPRNLEQMLPVFNDNARVFVARVAQHVGRGPAEVNMMDFVMDASLKSICDFIFGRDNKIDMDSTEFRGMKSVAERISEAFSKRMLYPWLRITPLFLFIYKKELEEINTLWNNFTTAPLKETEDSYERRLIKEDKQKGENDKIEPLNIVEVFRKLQENHPGFTKIDLMGEILNLYETGSDTVAHVACYCMMALAQHPDCQDKAYDEILSVVGPSADVTLNHISKLTYLEQCIKETLRRFTLLPVLLRKTSEDIELSECTVPAGHTIAFSTHGVHMNPRIYPDPKRFDPDRFSPENVASRDRNSFMAFSSGPRDCIGKRYGDMFMKVLFVNILRKYRMKPVLDVHNLKLKFSIVLTSTEGFPVVLEERAHSI